MGYNKDKQIDMMNENPQGNDDFIMEEIINDKLAEEADQAQKDAKSEAQEENE